MRKDREILKFLGLFVREKLWKSLLTFLAVLSGVIIFVPDDHLKTIAIIALIIYTVGILIYAIISWNLERNSRIRLECYPNWDGVPRRYTVEGIFDYADDHRIEIVARTCFRWLCGKETDLQREYVFESETSKQLRMFTQKLDKNPDFQIKMILQCPYSDMPWWAGEPKKIEANRMQFMAAIRNFGTIKKSLKYKSGQLKLQITMMPIATSMVRIKIHDPETENHERTVFLIVDQGDPRFLTEAFKESKSTIIKPFVVYETRTGNIEYYDKKFQEFSDLAPCTACSNNDCDVQLLRPELGLT